VSAAALVLAAALAAAGAPAPPAAPAREADVAEAWLAAVARGDTATIRGTTGLPFVYRSAAQRARCNAVARTDAALSKWAACFRKEQRILLDELRLGAIVRPAAPGDRAPKSVRDVAEAIPGPGRWLYAFINGDGITASFLFRVDGEGAAAKVTGLVLDLTVATG
jgi:hypothetical protein